MKTIKDIDVAKKRVLVRCDFNVALDEFGNITDDSKIMQSLPTIQYLLSQQARVILLSHLGQPDGKAVAALTMDKVREKLENALAMAVVKADDCVGKEVETLSVNLQPGQVLLLENVRFHREETENSRQFAKELSHLADVYVNDAFDVSHRAHASVVGVPEFLPHAAGVLLAQEVQGMRNFLKDIAHPFLVIMGGKKAETKAVFINKISETADEILIGGLLKQEIEDKGITLLHPEKIKGPAGNLMAPDLDVSTTEVFCQKILKAKTVIWNGPLGNVENRRYQAGTRKIAKAIIESKARALAGGGETVAFLRSEGMASQFTHVTTAGGAMLDYVSDQELPGLTALDK